MISWQIKHVAPVVERPKRTLTEIGRCLDSKNLLLSKVRLVLMGTTLQRQWQMGQEMV